jgi:lipooligosaccharide transport system ATP-binding protein
MPGRRVVVQVGAHTFVVGAAPAGGGVGAGGLVGAGVGVTDVEAGVVVAAHAPLPESAAPVTVMAKESAAATANRRTCPRRSGPSSTEKLEVERSVCAGVSMVSSMGGGLRIVARRLLACPQFCDQRASARPSSGFALSVLLDSLDRVSQHRSSSSPSDRASGLAATPATAPATAPGITQDVLIEARGLRKTFGEFVAVEGIDVQVHRGEAFGFLGPNGAGKSSTMRMVGCISPPSGGVLRVLGGDPATDGAQIRARLGVVPQQDSLDGELTVLDNLVVYARYFGYSRADSYARARRLLEFASLTDRADSLVEPLSGGMKRRLTIARSLVNDPEILLLDEPTTGLDPQARHVLWDRLFRLKRQGVTLVLTTHYMAEAEQLCDRLVVMDHGRIVAEGSPRELIDTWSSREVLELRFSDDDLTPHAERLEGVVAQGVAARVEVLPDRLLVYTDDGEAASSTIHDAGLRPMSSLVRRSSLEDVFLRLTGRTLVD